MKKIILLLLAVVAMTTKTRAQDMLSTPLSLEAITAGTISMNNPSSSALTIEYSKDGTTWTAVNTSPAITIDVAAGDVVRLRGNNEQYGNTPDDHNITSTAEVYVYGNIMSLVHATDFATNFRLTNSFAFKNLFCAGYSNDTDWQLITNNTIKSHPTKELLLPSPYVPCSCYADMFAGCEALERAPELPATEMDDWWYDEVTYDYSDGSIDCYMEMFKGCKNLKQGPSILPATQIVHGVYQYMFYGCMSLTKAPELPAAKVADCAYGHMFDGCTSLNYVKCLATDISEEMAVDEWLKDVPSSGTFIKSSEMTAWPEGASGIPAGWTVEDAAAFDPYVTPLTFEAIEYATTVTISNPLGLTIEYSTDGGSTWTSKSNATISISDIAPGGTVQLRGNNAAYSNGVIANSTIISFDKDCYVYGNMMSLVNSTGFATVTSLTANYTFFDLFDTNTHLKNYPGKDIVLPATTLTEGCYSNLFYKCSALSKAPALPAPVMATKCYERMFQSCTSLTVAPELPAMTMADHCYNFMFYGCNGLTAAPALPATTMAPYCYANMFGFCHSITETPALPATTLADYCYYRMFVGSNGLTTITSLPATTMAPYCYNEMFRQCRALTTGAKLPATELAEYCYRCMYQACTSLTTPSTLPASILAKGCYLGMYVNTGLTAAPSLPATTLAESCYYQMFQNNPHLVSSPALTATTLADMCYYKMFADCPLLETVGDISAITTGESSCEYMFMNCTSLVTAPALSATTLAPACYNFMFSGCSSLTNAPVLPATTLASQCYQRMFEGCTSLVTAPALPATNLADLCYNDMFWECTGLKNAPELPATELADYCYTMMFLGCTSLEKAPVLPAKTLTPGCYEHMFMNCNSLNYVKCMATDLGDESSTDGWLTNVAATGTFVQPAGVDWSGKGTTEGTWGDYGEEVPCTFVHGIPAGWTVQEAGDGFDLTVTAAGISTLYLDFPVAIPNDVNMLGVFYVNSIDGHIMLMERLHDYIPANNGVIVMANPGTFTFNRTDEEVEAITNNQLQGTTMATPVSSIDGKVYTLGHGKNSGYIGFYRYTGSSLPANKAFLVRDGSSDVNGFNLVLDNEDGTSTTIGHIENDEFILDVVYDLQGRRVERPGRGIYIVNGKKQYIK